MSNVQSTLGFYHAKQVQSLRSVRFAEPALCYVRQGQKQLLVGERCFQAQAGEWLILPAHTTFMMENRPYQGQYTAEVLPVPASLAKDFIQYTGGTLTSVTPLPADPDFSIAGSARLQQAWDKLTLTQQPAFPELLARHYLFEVLIVAALQNNLHALLQPATPGLADRVRQFMQADPAASWTQPEIASQFHMSAPTLRRHLALEKQSFREILEEVRMHHALQHVLTTHKPMDWIAGECGFNSASAFSSRFRQKYGVAPAALRKTC